eukprot:PhF_6_TR4815/c0_g2_i3/m.6648
MIFSFCAVVLFSSLCTAQDTNVPYVQQPTVAVVSTSSPFPYVAPHTSMCMDIASLGALTFQPGQIATRRRTPPVMTMQCTGDCPPVNMQAVQCVNRGVNDMGR